MFFRFSLCRWHSLGFLCVCARFVGTAMFHCPKSVWAFVAHACHVTPKNEVAPLVFCQDSQARTKLGSQVIASCLRGVLAPWGSSPRQRRKSSSSCSSSGSNSSNSSTRRTSDLCTLVGCPSSSTTIVFSTPFRCTCWSSKV